MPKALMTLIKQSLSVCQMNKAERLKGRVHQNKREILPLCQEIFDRT